MKNDIVLFYKLIIKTNIKLTMWRLKITLFT